jgi:hypothetical protein
MLDAHLGGPQDVPRGVKRDADAVDVDEPAILQRLYASVRPESRAEHALACLRREIGARPPPRVVTMRMRDDRAIDREPGVDMKATRLAEEALVGRTEEHD